MRGIKGLIIAIGLGIAGAALNFAYLQSKASNEVRVAFVGIKADKIVNRGQVLTEDDITDIQIPARWVGSLKSLGVLYEAKAGVVGQKALRNLSGERLLLRDDFGTPPPELNLEAGEELMWVPVDTRAFVPALVSPGDEVKFLLTGPTPAVRGASPGESAANEPLGPFTILTLGNRLSSSKVWKADKMPQVQENVLGIRINEKNSLMAEKLRRHLQATNYQQVGVMLESRQPKQP